ncbi:MAG: hypothetical protein U0L20_08660 [Ruminococcus sp.]|nr:hypothetical protein [Ruminococcus sp.]
MNKIEINRTKVIYNWWIYIVFAIQVLFSVGLIFNNNLWFDEAFTLSLIQHDFPQMIEIIKTDMHPPLYFISLKAFCMLFGYSIPVTKLFSVIGYIATLSLGITIIRRNFSAEIAVFYMVVIGAIPMSLYFSVQQRSYQWCVFFVTLCFIETLLFLKNPKKLHGIIIVVAGLAAAYNHFYALLAIGIVLCFLNFYVIIKMREQIITVIIVDVCMVAGYLPWLLVLYHQVSDASNNFWLKGVEPLCVIVFISGVIISVLILLNKENRKLPHLFAISSVLSIQFIGLMVTIFIRPFYIARYSVVTLGIFAFLIAISIQNIKKQSRKIAFILLCIIGIFTFIGTAVFEYNPSMSDSFERLNQKLSAEDTFLYCDSSFGIMSYYYPHNEHICTYSQSWFEAFDNLECIDKRQINKKLSFDNKVWFVKNEMTKIPDYINSNYILEKFDDFQCDFNHFQVYSLSNK